MTRMTPRRVGTLALAVALGLGPILAGAGASAGAASAGPLAQTPLVTSTFEDDFSGPANTAPDSATWAPRTMKGLFSHKELATYTDSTANISLDGRGHLRIRALRDTSGTTPTYTSGFLTSKDLVGPYMHIEARIKLAPGYGMWPLFWIQGINSEGVGWPATGEIDIAENPAKLPKEQWATAHGLSVPGTDYIAHWKSTTVLNTSRPLAAAYHVYGLNVTPDSLTWTFDGRVYKTLNRNQLGVGQVWSFNDPFVVILSLAVGGPFPGNPKPSTKFPSTMAVDYVKVTPG